MPDPLAPVDATVDDEFWTPRRRRNREIALSRQYESLRNTGRIDNFRKAAEGEGEFRGRYYNDSDVYKWLEAACHVLATETDPELESRVEETVAAIEDAQEDDGYLNTYFTLEAPDQRWTNLGSFHELYCAGHLVEAAVAHRRATGSDRLLDVARRFADHVDDTFGPDGRGGVPGHEEIELALVKLHRATGEERYLDLARYFVDRRGQPDSRLRWEFDHPDDLPGMEYNPGMDVRDIYREHMADDEGDYAGEYAQDHRPVRDQETPVGHAVRATYLYAAMTDLAAEDGDDELRAAVDRIWTATTEKRTYVTGAIGSTPVNEGFTRDYDLPKERAYAETCAAVGSVLWNHRLLRLTGDGRYADLLERTLYNAVLAGVSIDGRRYRYVNPHERTEGPHPLSEIDERRYDRERFDYRPQEWFTCACCPANVARLLASLERYVYLAGDDALSVSLYVGGAAETTLDGTDVRIEQHTDYPWEGAVRFDVETDRPATFALALRIPAWAENPTIRVGGQKRDVAVENGYATLEREWTDGDTVDLSFDLPVRQIEAHPDVHETADEVALQRGPIVYCFEARDNDASPHLLGLDADAPFRAEYDDDLLDGVVTLTGTARIPDDADRRGSLYRTRRERSTEPIDVTAVPYYGWGQRDDGEMAIWVSRT